jgi:hypothetical protein
MARWKRVLLGAVSGGVLFLILTPFENGSAPKEPQRPAPDETSPTSVSPAPQIVLSESREPTSEIHPGDEELPPLSNVWKNWNATANKEYEYSDWDDSYAKDNARWIASVYNTPTRNYLLDEECLADMYRRVGVTADLFLPFCREFKDSDALWYLCTEKIKEIANDPDALRVPSVGNREIGVNRFPCRRYKETKQQATADK